MFSDFSEINTLLSSLTTGLQAVLCDRLTALYLFGSLVWGDFDPDISDIDLLCVTESEMNGEEFAALHATHTAFARNHPHWKDRLEIAYISCAALRAIRNGPVSIAMLSPGEPFHRKETGEDWLINLYVTRQKGAALVGPPPTDLLPPVSKGEFLAAVKRQAAEWRTWIVHTRDSRPYQGYAILTMCRALHACRTGEQVSKAQAARWAMQVYPHWAEAIRTALRWRAEWRTPVDDHTATYPYTVATVRPMIDAIESLSTV